MDRDRSLESRVAEYGGLYGNCAQASFRALHDQFELEGDATLLVGALRFLPGVGQTYETCGAVSGCLAAFGLSCRRDEKERVQSRWTLAREFCVAVREQLGSTRCGEIMELKNGRRFDLLDPVQMQQYVETGAGNKCGEVVQTAVRIAATLFERKANRKP